jgi:hypothetical protein
MWELEIIEVGKRSKIAGGIILRNRSSKELN